MQIIPTEIRCGIVVQGDELAVATYKFECVLHFVPQDGMTIAIGSKDNKGIPRLELGVALVEYDLDSGQLRVYTGVSAPNKDAVVFVRKIFESLNWTEEEE